MGKDKLAVYLFCFAEAKLLPDVRRIEIEPIESDSHLSVLTFGNVAAVHSLVPLEDFTGPEAEARLGDLEWIGPRAIFHEMVIEEIAKFSPVYPARFGTIYLSEANLETFMAAHSDTLSRFFEYAADKREWAVKGYMDSQKSIDRLREKIVRESKDLPRSPGARYLAEKRLRGSISDRLQEWLAEILTNANRILVPAAVEFRERKILPETGAERPGEMVSNWAFLIPKKGESKFENKLETLNKEYEQEGITFQLSGPWPPFSFIPPLEDLGPIL